MSNRVIGQEEHPRWGALYVVRFDDLDYVPPMHCGPQGSDVIAEHVDIPDLPASQWLIYASFRNCDALHLVICEQDSRGLFRLTA